MDLRGRRRSTNIEDRRGMRPGRTGVGLSLGGILFLIVLSFFGINPLPFLGMATKTTDVQMQPSDQPYQESAQEAQLSETAAVVLAETEETWTKMFGPEYVPPTLVLFTQVTPSACGTGQAAMGPFYCPNDRKVYLDLSFFNELESRFGAPGDFAQAYVIAHEVGHHLQNLMGISDQVHSARERMGQVEGNDLSVRQELQADCFAGVWARDAASRKLLEPGDVEEALDAATAIGDDRLQRHSQGVVVPDAFTHGSSEQRKRWLNVGMSSGDPKACDTFNAARL
jgi:predicted metalloprotease